MPLKLIGALIQAAAPMTDPSVPIDEIRKAAIDAHIPLIDEANPSQGARWYDTAEAVTGSEEKDELVVAESSGSMAELLP